MREFIFVCNIRFGILDHNVLRVLIDLHFVLVAPNI